jgi:hypothetical protein
MHRLHPNFLAAKAWFKLASTGNFLKPEEAAVSPKNLEMLLKKDSGKMGSHPLEEIKILCGKAGKQK